MDSCLHHGRHAHILKVPARLSISLPGVNSPVSRVVTSDTEPRSFYSSGVLQVKLCHFLFQHLCCLLVPLQFALQSQEQSFGDR